MKKSGEKDTVPCETCGKPLGPDENLIGLKCQECHAEDESCGCSDV